jgi:NarL family two-component system response regulator LiaR
MGAPAGVAWQSTMAEAQSGRNGQRTRVLIVEDHQVVGQGLRALIEREPDLEVVDVVGTVAGSARMPSTTDIDVVLADFRLPDGNGGEAIAALRKRHPKLRALFLTAVESPAALMTAIQAGARGYVLKSRAAEDVVIAVRRVARGEMLIDASKLADLLQLKGEQTHLYDTLTAREREVLRLLARGLDNHAIAKQLGFRYATARSHVRNLLAKLEVHSKMEAVVKAAALGLIDPDAAILPQMDEF